MNKVLGVVAVSLLTTGLGVGVAAAATGLNGQQSKLSYSMGYATGKAFQSHSVNISSNEFAMGLQDGMSGTKPKLSEQQMKQTLATFQKQSMRNMENKFKQLATKNKQMGAAFLAANKSKKGVVTLADGMQYRVVKKGSGAKPSLRDTVTVNYEGRLINGRVFDSSYKRGKPATFPVNGVIKGWQQALQLMPVGSTWMLYIPPQLAYGMQGAPGSIGPNETLIFKVHLMAIKK